MEEPLSEHPYPPPDYARYRRRKVWLTTRERVLQRDSRRCFRCAGPAEVVHHRSYAPDVIVGAADEWLISLCHGCHENVEFDDAGFRRSWLEKERSLITPDRGTDIPEPAVDLRRRSTPRPAGWERMTKLRQQAWNQRAAQLINERRKRNPSSDWYATRAEAETAAFEILGAAPRHAITLSRPLGPA